MVKQGAGWRIGSPANVSLLGASWLKDDLSVPMDNPIFASLVQVKLCDFIDQSSKAWKTPLIYNLFNANITHLIVKTPLQPLVADDKLI